MIVIGRIGDGGVYFFDDIEDAIKLFKKHARLRECEVLIENCKLTEERIKLFIQLLMIDWRIHIFPRAIFLKGKKVSEFTVVGISEEL